MRGSHSFSKTSSEAHLVDQLRRTRRSSSVTIRGFAFTRRVLRSSPSRRQPCAAVISRVLLRYTTQPLTIRPRIPASFSLATWFPQLVLIRLHEICWQSSLCRIFQESETISG